MCIAIFSTQHRTIAGCNVDLADMECRVAEYEDRVCVEVFDEKEGWIPLFGANARGDFVTMPTCWPADSRSDPVEGKTLPNVVNLVADLLLMKRTFAETVHLAEGGVCSVPGLTFQAQLTDADGNLLQIVPGQGNRYMERPPITVMTNFSPFKGDSEKHPWMGLDRYRRALDVVENGGWHFGVEECFVALREASQKGDCPTRVSMVYDVDEKIVYWCEDREWKCVRKKRF